MERVLSLDVWRRGRGILTWQFEYVEKGDKTWFSTPGWYHRARKNVYRLTIDHDFPENMVWLGRKRGKVWENVERLYEPVSFYNGSIVTGIPRPSRRYNAGPKRSSKRQLLSKGYAGYRAKETLGLL